MWVKIGDVITGPVISPEAIFGTKLKECDELAVEAKFMECEKHILLCPSVSF